MFTLPSSRNDRILLKGHETLNHPSIVDHYTVDILVRSEIRHQLLDKMNIFFYLYGIQLGLAHLPASICKRCEDILNLLND